MKQLIFLAGILSLLAFSTSASADDRHRRGNDRYFNGNHVSVNNYGRSNAHFRRAYPRRNTRSYNTFYSSYYGPFYGGYDRPYYGSGSYWSFSVGRNYHRDRFDAGTFLGGVVLGSVLGNSVASARQQRQYDYYEPESRVRVIRRTPVTVREAAPSRRLLRDLSGRCYEIVRDGKGSETRVELDPSACNF